VTAPVHRHGKGVMPTICTVQQESRRGLPMNAAGDVMLHCVQHDTFTVSRYSAAGHPDDNGMSSSGVASSALPCRGIAADRHLVLAAGLAVRSPLKSAPVYVRASWLTQARVSNSWYPITSPRTLT